MAMASSRTAPPRTAWVCASCDSARNALARQFGSSPGRISERLLNVISQRITDDGYEERESRTNHSNHFQHAGTRPLPILERTQQIAWSSGLTRSGGRSLLAV